MNKLHEMDFWKALNFKGSFTYYVTQHRWVGGLQNVNIPMQLEKLYYVKALLGVGGWSK